MIKTYESYKDSGIPWIGEIPAKWNVKKLGAFYNQRNEKVSDKDFMPLSVSKKGIVPQLETAAKSDDGDNRKLVRKGDFAINSRSDRRGSCGISDYDGSVSLINTVLCPKGEMNEDFYNWLFHTSMFADEFYKWGHGIVDDLWTTKWSDMKNISVVEPSLCEQRAIAAYLDEKCTDIDELVSLQEEIIKELESYKQSIITEAVTKGLDPNVTMKDSGIEWIGEIPEGWKTKKFKHLFKTQAGITFSKGQLVTDGERVISYGQIHSKINTFTSVNPCLIKYIPITVTKNNNNTLAFSGDFIFADTSEDIEGCGNFVYIDTKKPIYAGYHTFLAKKCNHEYDKYLAYLFMSWKWRSQVRSKVNGIKVYSITQSIINSVFIILPPLSEQIKIASYLDKQCAEINAMIALKVQKIEELKEYKKSVIFEAVTGKIKVV